MICKHCKHRATYMASLVRHIRAVHGLIASTSDMERDNAY